LAVRNCNGGRGVVMFRLFVKRAEFVETGKGEFVEGIED
jgi:hypothetical protein